MMRLLFSIIFNIIIFAASGCSKKENDKIFLGKSEPELKKQDEIKNLRIAVGGIVTPKEGLKYYHELLQYIQDKIGEKINFVDRESYAEINEMLRTGRLDAAFVCSGPYTDGKKRFDLELLVAPQAYGDTVYYSYIIVKKDSSFQSFQSLQGKSFAFTDPLSNTGKLVPTYMLAKINQTPDKFFSKVIFTHSHDKSIKAVAQDIVDGAAVDSLIWEYLNTTNPEFTSETRVLEKSPPYAIPPFVVAPGLDQNIKHKLKAVLLKAHQDSQGKQILQNMKIDKFVEINDKAYDSVRNMKKWLEDNKKANNLCLA